MPEDPLDSLKTDMQRGFDKIDKKLDDVVSKGEFQATVARLDSSDQEARRDIERLRDDAEQDHANILARIEGFSATAWKIAGLAGTIVGAIAAVAEWIVTIIH